MRSVTKLDTKTCDAALVLKSESWYIYRRQRRQCSSLVPPVYDAGSSVWSCMLTQMPQNPSKCRYKMFECHCNAVQGAQSFMSRPNLVGLV